MASNGQEPDGTDLPETSPLSDFFANYHPTFEYDPTRSASLEFYRLCDVFGWDREDPDRKEAHRNFKDALVEQFNRLYGTDKDNIEHWQALCYVIRIEPVPETLTACRKAVRGAYVNLVDLVDTYTTGEDVRVFDTERELSRYTRSTGKFFPRNEAKAGGLLRYLLRQIFRPRSGQRR